VQATTCALYPCVKNYRSTVNNGVLDETVNSETPLLPDLNEYPATFYDQTGFNTPCIIDGQQYDLSNVSKVPGQIHDLNTTLVNGRKYYSSEPMLLFDEWDMAASPQLVSRHHTFWSVCAS
jgi:hypothetical protein